MKLSRMMNAAALVALAAAVGAPAPAFAQGFGQSLAVGQGEVLIGESLNTSEPGYIYVYRPNGSGEWVEAQRIAASDATPNDHFGRTLALDGGSLVVGATVAPGGVSGQATGALYAFEKGRDGMWRQTQMLVPDGIAAGESFGRVAVRHGDRVLMSAWGDEGGRGAAYLFRRGADGRWVQEARLAGDDLAENDFFGSAMDFNEELAVVSALHNNPQGQNRGAVYTFRRGPDGAWSQVSRMDYPEAQPGEQFGASLHLLGDELLVGHLRPNQFAGEVLRYSWTGDGWEPAGAIGPFDGANPGAGFGAAMKRIGDELWIAGPGAGGQEGRIYRLALGDDGIESATKLGPDTLEPGDAFGSIFDARGDLAAVTLSGADYGLGRVSVLERRGGAWVETASLFREERSLEAITGGQVDCTDGTVSEFPCQDVDIVSFLPVKDIGGERGVRLNDVWGWTDPRTGAEIAIVGRVDGTSFVDISDPSSPRYLGDLPMTEGANANSWRDMKVYRDHVFVVADGAGPHGMQVFDLTRLRDVREPRTFDADAHYDNIASAHNIVIDTVAGTAMAVGVNGGGVSCGGGLHMIDIRDPKSPTFLGCFADPQTGNAGTGYSHDAQCVTYEGPDAEHRGKQICLGANETMLSIADVTDKENPVALSRASYPNVAYAHQGWLTDDQRYFYMNDEGDESVMQQQGMTPQTRTLIWDVADLDDPVLVGEYFHDNPSIDHNLYIKGNLMYQSNYVSGLRILDISQPEAPKLVGYLDTVPWGDDMPSFDGSWSNYPFFASGVIVVTSGAEGVFFVRKRDRAVIP